jgi:hypothetical protein
MQDSDFEVRWGCSITYSLVLGMLLVCLLYSKGNIVNVSRGINKMYVCSARATRPVEKAEFLVLYGFFCFFELGSVFFSTGFYVFVWGSVS